MGKGHGKSRESHQSSGRKPRQNNPPAPRHTDNTTKEYNSAGGKSTPPFQIEPTPTPAEEPQQKWYSSFQWWKGRLEFLGICAAIGYAIVTYLQWRDLRHNFEAEQRAWLKAEPEIPDGLTPNTVARVTFRNIGKSPALEVLGALTVEVVDADKSPAFVQGNIRQVRSNMLFQADLISFASGISPVKSDGTTRPLDAHEIERLSNGDAYLAAFGLVAYRDQFGYHWTKYCTWKSYQSGRKSFHTQHCVDWNSVGDGLTKWGAPPQ